MTKKTSRTSVRSWGARKLLSEPLFLHRTMRKIGELGVVGEEGNRLALFLAGLTKDCDEPVSALVRGPSSSGKSNLVRNVLQLFPPEVVITRATLSSKAPVYGRG